MADCRYYSWNSGDNDCFKLQRRVKSSVADQYCSSWNYLDCPVFKSYSNDAYDLRNEFESFLNDYSGGCFLTTACVEARHLPDNCEELETLRRFRDTWLQENHPCDVPYYYAVAPRIVATINARKDSADVWNKLYNELVMPCLKMIQLGDNEGAYAHYKKTTLELERSYLR